MTEYADYLSGSNLPKVEYSVLTDEKHGKYQLLAVGWEKTSAFIRSFFILTSWASTFGFNEDNTEDGFANLLMERGVEKKDIVLAYYPESHRHSGQVSGLA